MTKLMKSVTKLLVMLLLGMTAMQAQAQQIDVQTAMQNARKFLYSSPRAKVRALANRSLTLAYTGEVKGEKHYYVFNTGNADSGFVIVGGDEAANTILGYSSTGSFDYATAPANVKWWLSQYDAQIAEAIAQQAAAPQGVDSQGKSLSDQITARKTSRKAPARKADVEDLMTTKWDQDSPYNSQIPSLGESNEPLVTGCVATAMAQVMKYHNWPTQGEGSNAYSKDFGYPIGTINFQANFGDTTYDWANMSDTYSSDAAVDDQASIAVGTLMYHVGVSINMDYNQSSQGGSGASNTDVGPTLINNFKYDKGIKFRQRAYYSDDEWEALVYDELKAGRPVVYGGYSGDQGHCFVCHGYQADIDLFAINWGWGGYCDGYYALTGADALKPDGSGIGGAGADSAYKEQQNAVFGIQPDKGNPAEIVVNCFDSYKLSTTSGGAAETLCPYDYSVGNNLYITCGPQNFSCVNASFYTGVLLRETTTGKTYCKSLASYTDWEPFYYNDTTCIYAFNPKTMGITYNGTYEVYPVFCETASTNPADWTIMRYTGNVVPEIQVTGAIDDAKVNVVFDLNGLDIQLNRTAEITHSKTYSGVFEYTSSDPSVAEVDDSGMINAKALGTATITAKALGDGKYNETTKAFDITVVETVLDEVEFNVASTDLAPSETVEITHSSDYYGEIEYKSSDDAVATVSSTGQIEAVEPGIATITAYASGNELFKKTLKTFTITVKAGIAEASGYVITEIPVAGCDNFISETANELYVPWKNNSGSSIPAENTYIYVKLNTDSGWVLTGAYYNDLDAGMTDTAQLELSTDELTPGNNYTIEFYHNYDRATQTFSDPFNVPSITVTYVDDITIPFKMTEANYGTLCLPFDAEVPAGLKAYECSTYDSDGVAKLTRSMTIKRNTPYIMRPVIKLGTGESNTYSFTGPDARGGIQTSSKGMLLGVLADNFVLQEEHYILQNHSGKVGFYNVGDGSRLGTNAKQYSSLLVIPGTYESMLSASASLPDGIFLPSELFDDDEEGKNVETAIQSMNTESSTAIFSLSGIRLSAPQQGVSIIRTADGKYKKVTK